MAVTGIGWEDVKWTDLVQDRESWQAVVHTVMNVWGFTKCGVFLE
jgi:hypothetical protein